MRTPIASALLVVFGLVFFTPSAAAQSSPIPPQPQSPQQAPQKPPSSAKPLLLPPATQVVLLPKHDSSASDPTMTVQELRTWIQTRQNRKDGPGLMSFGDGPDAPNCGHIQIIQAPEMDSEMIVEAPPGAGGNITTFQGLPPCRRDLPAPMTAQRFYGVPPMLPFPPRKPSARPPASQIPSGQTQPAQNKPEASAQP